MPDMILNRTRFKKLALPIFGLCVAIIWFFTSNPNIINLEPLYLGGYSAATTQNCTNFIRVTTGEVLFFNPEVYNSLIALCRQGGKPFDANFLVMEYPSRSVRFAVMRVSRERNSLAFGGLIASNSELERLRLEPIWENVKNACAGKPLKIGRAGVVKIAESDFLITGGLSRDSKNSIMAPSKTAIVYDAKRNVISKKFSLHQQWIDHQSFMLPNGQVLLTGNAAGSNVTQKAELVDVVNATSTEIDLVLEPRSEGTVCVNSLGRCLIIGGWNLPKKEKLEIEEIRFSPISSKVVGKIASSRLYNDSLSTNLDAPQAIFLDENHVLISGGLGASDFDGYVPRKYAEIVTITGN